MPSPGLQTYRKRSFSFLIVWSLYYNACGNLCTSKNQASVPSPKGMKEVPVVLMIGTLGSDVRIPCRYCGQNVSINSRIWKCRNLKGQEEEVKVDMHDDEQKNRVVVDRDHSLIIRDLQEKDGAYYFCYEVGDNSKNSLKMDILLDIGYRSTLEPKVLELPTNIEEEVKKTLSLCKKLKDIPALANYQCYSEWGSWSQCDVCGKVGKRKRVGACRLQKFAKASIETQAGKFVEANFPIVGIGCHSVLLNALPKAKQLLAKVPNIVLEEKCEVSCDNYSSAASAMKAYKKGSFLNKIKLKSGKFKQKGSQPVITESKEEQEGTSLTLFCPGTSLDTPVKWKKGNQALIPEKVKQKTDGRLTIDATDALHIRELRKTDGGEYACIANDIEVGIVRLKVLTNLAVFDPTSNFGILTIGIMLSFMLWVTLISLKWKSFKLKQNLQQKRVKDKISYSSIPVDTEET